MSGPRFLRLRTVHDAIIVPRRDHDDRAQGAGVVRRTEGGLVAVAETGVRRRGRQYIEPPPTADVVASSRIDTAVFAGYVYAHFGHFLLESLGRLWFDGVDPETPVVWIPATGDHFTPWMTELTDLIGVGEDRLVLGGASGALEVGELLVPDQGFEVHRYLHPWLVRRLAIHPSAPEPDRRVWLSRSALGEHGGVAEEVEIERRLADLGWMIIHPEQLTVRAQLEVVARATSVAGVEGSAFHTLLLLSGYRGTIDVVTRHDSPNFELIADAVGWDQVRHPMFGGQAEEWHRPSGARDVRWSGVDVDKVVHTIVRSSSRKADPAHESVRERLRRAALRVPGAAIRLARMRDRRPSR